MKIENTPEAVQEKVRTVAESAATIQALMDNVMQQDVHFGVIPGTGSKPTLLKPGAEVMLKAFGFYAIVDHENTIVENLDGGHKNFVVSVDIYDQEGTRVATGIGSCSTLEGRYRFRSENTGLPVPKEYWDSRNKELIGGAGYSVKKAPDGKWMIYRKVVHDNPADFWNTCLKMAKKRAAVDGAITACGASDMFTQDIEEMVDLLVGEPVEPVEPMEKPRRKQKKSEEAQAPVEEDAAENKISGDTYTGIVKNVESGATGAKGNKKWTRYDMEFEDGTKLSTFSRSVAVAAFEASKIGEPITLKLRHKNGYTTADSIVESDGEESENDG